MWSLVKRLEIPPKRLAHTHFIAHSKILRESGTVEYKHASHVRNAAQAFRYARLNHMFIAKVDLQELKSTFEYLIEAMSFEDRWSAAIVEYRQYQNNTTALFAFRNEQDALKMRLILP